MPPVEDARRDLIEAQSDKQQLDLDYETLLKNLEQFEKERDAIDAERQKAKLRLRRAREELQREESLQASKDQAAQVYGEMGERAAELAKRAQEFEWSQSMTGQFEFQMFGVIFGTIAKRWLCGDEPGLGKTRQAVGYMDLIGAKRVLIVCEANICEQFAGEVMELAPHRDVYMLREQGPVRRHEMLDEAMSKEDGAVVVVNYEIWRKDKEFIPKLKRWGIDTVIVDEAHNIKKASTSNYKNIAEIVEADNVCPNCGGTALEGFSYVENKRRKLIPCAFCGWTLAQVDKSLSKLDQLLSTRSVKNLMLLTGTPILNSPLDLYSLLHLIDPALFPMESMFKQAYLRQDHFSKKWVWRTGGVRELQPLIGGRFLARKKADVGIILPKQSIHVVPVEIDPQLYPLQYRTIRQITDYAEIELTNGKTMTIMHLISIITRKRQANVWPAGIEIRDDEGNVIFSVGEEVQESAKIDKMVENILKLDREGRRQVVFSQFKTALAEVENRLREAGIRVVRFDGDTPKALRERVRKNFYRAQNERPEWDVVLANYKTGGSGLNLTAATVTHVLDHEWNPGKRDQGYGRTFRIGQTEPTEVYDYRAPRTVDTWMSNLMRYKERLVGEFEGTMMEPEQKLTVASILKAMKSGEML
jgi:SNF2 family DNA or RNA helicase